MIADAALDAIDPGFGGVVEGLRHCEENRPRSAALAFGLTILGLPFAGKLRLGRGFIDDFGRRLDDVPGQMHITPPARLGGGIFRSSPGLEGSRSGLLVSSIRHRPSIIPGN
jgi:hypothetical protein